MYTPYPGMPHGILVEIAFDRRGMVMAVLNTLQVGVASDHRFKTAVSCFVTQSSFLVPTKAAYERAAINFVRLYCGPQPADRELSMAILLLMQAARQSKLVAQNVALFYQLGPNTADGIKKSLDGVGHSEDK